MEQLAFADVVVINKIDLVTASEKNELEQRVKVMTLWSLYFAALLAL